MTLKDFMDSKISYKDSVSEAISRRGNSSINIDPKTKDGLIETLKGLGYVEKDEYGFLTSLETLRYAVTKDYLYVANEKYPKEVYYSIEYGKDGYQKEIWEIDTNRRGHRKSYGDLMAYIKWNY